MQRYRVLLYDRNVRSSANLWACMRFSLIVNTNTKKKKMKMFSNFSSKSDRETWIMILAIKWSDTSFRNTRYQKHLSRREKARKCSRAFCQELTFFKSLIWIEISVLWWRWWINEKYLMSKSLKRQLIEASNRRLDVEKM